MFHHTDYRDTRPQCIAYRCIIINSHQSRPENVYLTRRVSLVEQEHLSSPPVFSGVRVTRSLVLCVCFFKSLFVLFLLAIVLSFFLRYTDSHYPFWYLQTLLNFVKIAVNLICQLLLLCYARSTQQVPLVEE